MRRHNARLPYRGRDSGADESESLTRRPRFAIGTDQLADAVDHAVHPAGRGAEPASARSELLESSGVERQAGGRGGGQRADAEFPGNAIVESITFIIRFVAKVFSGFLAVSY